MNKASHLAPGRTGVSRHFLFFSSLFSFHQLCFFCAVKKVSLFLRRNFPWEGNLEKGEQKENVLPKTKSMQFLVLKELFPSKILIIKKNLFFS